MTERLTSLDENPDSQPPDQQKQEAIFSWIFAPTDKSFYHRGGSCKLLETQHHNKWEHAQRNGFFSWVRSKAEIHTQKECGVPPVSAVKRWLSHFYRSVFLGLCLLLASYLVYFSTLTYLGSLPWVCTNTPAKGGLGVKASGSSKTHCGLGLSPDIRPTRSISAHVQSPFPKKGGGHAACMH